jgi:hypothetical protein
MLEILALIWMCRSIGTKLRKKGYQKRWPYQLLLVVLWFTGELMGGIIGGVIAALQGMTENDGAMLIAWIIGLIGAIIGAVIVFVIVGGLPPAEVEEEFVLPDGDYGARFRPGRVAREGEDPREDITRTPHDGDPDDRVRT